MSRSFYSAVLLGNPYVTGETKLLIGSAFASAVPVITISSSNHEVLSQLSNSAGTGVKTGPVIDGTLGVGFFVDDGSTDKQVFVSVDDVEVTGVVVQAASLAGSVTRTRAGAASEAFVAGMAVGATLATA